MNPLKLGLIHMHNPSLPDFLCPSSDVLVANIEKVVELLVIGS